MFFAAGIILAGGRSRRMGRDKALLPLPHDNTRTFASSLASLLTSLCSEVVLVARDAEQAAGYSYPGVHRVTDQRPGMGPLMGLYSGLQRIEASHALVTAVDMPFVRPELVSFLLSQHLDDAPLIPVVGAVPQVLLAVYPRSVLPRIEQLLEEGRRDVRALLTRVRVRNVDETQLRQVDPGLRSFININTPGEYEQYHAGIP